ncbi:low molecular weight protein-tyrosine-phosphatase [Phycicoccus sp. Soil802]|uniref:low molecular weight protein-tyrosine-phosphatase n=1 Tax=Phycicoccus sp. Soil802 TaxID=1736414 RepID=UPI0007034D3B|nr:low molecular weight protein-tyrosine-phosphatase [Phycicoccus sp. Soil802]KRF28163.1 protein tyrosine phosphatase [Phycicoccus sp. Soil802]
MAPELHEKRPYRVTVVCTGNICRSPMGEFVLRERFEEAGLGDQVVVDSAGTHSWEVGNPADPRTLAVLARNGHDDFGGRDHVARRFERSWLDEVDLVLAADAGHLRELTKLARTDSQRAKVRMFRSFDPDAQRSGELDMDDPWYGDDSAFDQTYAEVVAAADGVVDHVRRALADRNS